jgi:uncharacterized protein (DUF2126 family)/transglutaminase-like putative cysteine protease
MIRVALEHRTTYRFDRPVRLSPHVVRLRPAPHCRTPVLAYSLRVDPEAHFLNWQQDPFGNYLARLVFPDVAEALDITVDLIADMTVINPFDFFVEEGAEAYPFRYEAGLAHQLVPYLVTDPAGPLLTAWVEDARASIGAGRVPINDFLVELNRRVHGDVAYTIRMESGVNAPEETLAKGVGSCRDSAWLFVQILRRMGLAARFVSGYLVQLVADRVPLDGPAGPSADFTDLHAWAEVYVPGAGWLGLDPTSGLFAGEGHLPLACTPEPESAAPVAGATDPCEVSFEHTNVVRRVQEDARVTKPYTDEQWTRIDALGRAVDADLVAGDVRLTVGGEPTFVSIGNMEAPEWNTAADGEHKRALAWDLTRRLATRFAPGGIVHHGQGKWFPGELLPRWNYGVYWRADAEPLWRDPTLLAGPGAAGVGDDGSPGDGAPGEGATGDGARALALEIAGRLGIPSDCCAPAYEDPAHRLWQEASLPPGLPPDRDARAELVARLDADRGEPAGWVLPVHRCVEGGGWGTSRWRTRRAHLFLVPGDSPVGLRLPLSTLAWAPLPPDPPRSPFEARRPLSQPGGTPVAPARVVPPGEAPPTAVCTEVRGGTVRVFLPPVQELEHWIELVRAVEDAVASRGAAVILEGYPPPADPRLCRLAVGSDPGVVEVNVHPVASWPEMVTTVTGLYEDARQARLGTEKFALDGTHTGTGGGNHMTLGGPTAADSPLLRRPDLVRSLVTYWQHHPSLSYLFSSRFVGPTSQAPRVDEARHDSLDELEIAFGELDQLDDEARPWMVDRLLRHLLVDVSGNTHRAEFCIDKLFSPEGEQGRLGLVEMRAFEMPPHPRMALVQALLVRALVARCWNDPYRSRLVRWGTELHDRFLLPWYVAADAGEVLDDLRAHGYPFEPAWLDPFVEFRFPRLGAVDVDGARIELRGAIEPWPVLGEEVTAAGTARAVDSSVERLQVLVAGMTDGRHVLTCNQVRVPLSPTAAPGVSVAGVRYKAWKPPSALHPTIDVHTPLVFDLVDTWNGRSLGGCTYHVAHPGGRHEERFPVNANEAEARRTCRFQPFGHTPGPVDVALCRVPDNAGGQGYPRTLDLRRTRSP